MISIQTTQIPYANLKPLHWLYLLMLMFSSVFISHSVQANSLERLFAPEAELWAFWEKHDKTSKQKIDHSQWDEFLQRYVTQNADGINRVRYAAVNKDDKASLEKYITYLAKQPLRRFNQQEQLVYWINLYNALTVQVILQHYPVEGIREIDISPGFFSDGPWGKKLLNIEKQEISLNDIEHRILRPIWQDPRIHYALNCASIGCPNLQTVAFSVDTIEAVLEQAAYDYVNHPRGVSVDKYKLTVSSIYNWFQTDFGKDENAVIHHIKIYAAPELQNALQLINNIDDYEYDWLLNDASPAPAIKQDEEDSF